MSSLVWNHFEVDIANDKFAKCKTCLKLISRGGSGYASKSTSNLMKHLKIHNIDLSSKKAKSEASKFTQNASGSSMLSFVQKSNNHTEIANKQSSELVRPSNHSAVGLDQSAHCSKSIASPLNIDIPTQHFTLAEMEESPNMDVDDPSASAESSASTSSQGSCPKKIKLKSKQLTLPNVADRMKKFQLSDSRAVHINNLIAAMICSYLQPISMVENKGFKRLINHLEPRYTIPSRKTFTNKILNGIYHDTLKKLQVEMMDVTSVSITTDMWTNISQVDFMAITAHFVTSDGLRVHKCLEVTPFPEVSHTAINLRNFLVKVLNDWNLSSKVVAVVRDNGLDITSALEISDYAAVPCAAHTLQLVVKDGFFNNPKVTNVVAKAKKLVGSFKHSAKNTKVLKSTQKTLGLPSHKMIQDEPTRWNSTFYMLRRLQEQKQALILISSYPDIKLAVELTSEDWKTIDVAVEILEIFETATQQLSKESSSISEVIPMVNTIQHVLEIRAPQGSGLQGLKNDLLASLKRRYRNVEDNMMYACATILDPRFKTTPFKDVDKIDIAKANILREVRDICPPEVVVNSGATAESSNDQEEDLRYKTKSGFWHHYRSAFEQTAVSPGTSTDPAHVAESELAAYLDECNLDPKNSDKVFNYWSLSSHQHLKKVAFKYLCVPPCTVFSERLFSLAGNICETKRNRLDPDRVKMLVFLHKNLE